MIGALFALAKQHSRKERDWWCSNEERVSFQWGGGDAILTITVFYNLKTRVLRIPQEMVHFIEL